jgi:membrane protease YdiL (CAAX protease family)
MHYVRMRRNDMVWRPAPGWPDTPPGWVPPPGWQPPAEWPPAPADWVFWQPAEPRAAEPRAAEPRAAEPRVPTPIVPAELTRDSLVRETRLVMIAALFPWIVSAVIVLAVHLDINNSLTQLPTFTPHQAALNVVLGVLSYMPTAAVVPLVLFLLARTGQPPSSLGLTRLRWADFGSGVGLAAAAFGCELLIAIALAPLEHSRLLNTAKVLHVPAYYVIFAVSQSLITAVAEEVCVNGYLLTRLDQLGWSPTRAFWLSLALRTSYHVYYGIGIVFTLPFGYFVTRSFQKHRKLNRPILAHFLFDTTAFLIAILVH